MFTKIRSKVGAASLTLSTMLVAGMAFAPAAAVARIVGVCACVVHSDGSGACICVIWG